jgi:hypothetical protein
VRVGLDELAYGQAVCGFFRRDGEVFHQASFA